MGVAGRARERVRGGGLGGWGRLGPVCAGGLVGGCGWCRWGGGVGLD